MTNHGLDDLGEDVTGFGRTEVRTVVHTLTRPAAMLDAYMRGGSTGDGLYSRPLKLYIALNGLLLAAMFLMGGTESWVTATVPQDMLAGLVEQSGKSRDAFVADLDGWINFLMIPTASAAYALAMAPLIRWWDPEDLGWRRAFRAAFAYLNAWTAPVLPLFWLPYLPQTEGWTFPIIVILSLAAFVRMGRGRWWTSPLAAGGKGLLAVLALQLAATLVSIPVVGLALLGAIYGA